jgi:adenine-specific DNA methylase
LRKESFVSGANSKSSRFIQENGFDRIAVVREFPPTPAMEGTQRDDPESHGCGLSNALIAVGDYDLGYEVFSQGFLPGCSRLGGSVARAAHTAQLNRRCQCNNWRNTPMTSSYPKRLIEVDLPIRRISEHARREKSIRHGHISTLHIWWARRPLAACRAVICAALWPDPADNGCPAAFRVIAAERMYRWARECIQHHSMESHPGFVVVRQHSSAFALSQYPTTLRKALLDFIADFANWDNSTVKEFLDTARALTAAAHYGLSCAQEDEKCEPFEWPGERAWVVETGKLEVAIANHPRPLIVDPFAGGGSIPLEALRVGADAFASDLNPVPVLLNKVILEYIPKYGHRLADEVRKWGEWIKREAEKELTEFYPKDPDGATPIAYLWARTIKCEGPGCGAEVPLLRSLWLSKKGKCSVALEIKPHRDKRCIEFEIHRNVKASDVGRGTCSGGTATCPICGYTTPVESVRAQLAKRHGGACDARLIAVITNRAGKSGQSFRPPSKHDEIAVEAAVAELQRRSEQNKIGISLVPDAPINHLRGFFNIVLYGITVWGDIFSPRQALTLSTFARMVRELPGDDLSREGNSRLLEAVKTCLALIVDRVAVRCTANCIWDATTGCIMQVFNQGQSLPARWEFAEMSACIDSGSGWATSVEYTIKVMEHGACIPHEGRAEKASATTHPLPNDSAQAVITDPPYYAAIPYADLSDFLFSWLKRSLVGHHEELLRPQVTDKAQELVSLSHRAAMYREKDSRWFEQQMGLACAEARRVCEPRGLGVVVFANKETKAWEAMLAGLIDAGWVVTASWPIDTESGNRLRAKGSAALASSVHLVCRPRENPDGSVRTDEIGDWRDVLQELPRRIHDWMPRLAEEGVVGADAIFACLGPALEIFSRYSRVEKASGEAVQLREYLEQVWAAVSREALSMIFEGASTEGFEPDARLTAMWLWTLSVGAQTGSGDGESEESREDEEDQAKGGKSKVGYALEFDAARKIAQGLGAHLEDLRHVVEIAGETARLLPVTERTAYLVGKDQAAAPTWRRKKKSPQLDLFSELAQEGVSEAAWAEKTVTKIGETTLDCIHQSMILFAAGRSEALKRFLVDDAAGRDTKFWRLAQALSALYPPKSDEKRWVDGVLAKKKGFGL